MISEHQKPKTSDMIEKLAMIIADQGKTFALIDHTTSNPTRANVQKLIASMESAQKVVSEITPKIELFQEQAIFNNDPEAPRLYPIVSSKVGGLQHAIIEQIQMIDAKITTGFRYTSYNKLLSKKIQHVNNTIDSCIKNVEDSKI